MSRASVKKLAATSTAEFNQPVSEGQRYLFRHPVAALTALLIFGLAISGCGVQHKLDDMHDATLDLREHTIKLGTVTQDLKGLTAETYDTIKQASVAERRNAFKGVVDARDPVSKLSEAVTYFMAFDMQLWSGLGEDNEERRLISESLAVQEFLRNVQSLIKPGQVNALPLAGWTIGFWQEDEINRQASLNAMSVAMFKNHPKQELMLRTHPEMKLVTMYSLIQDALRANVLIERGEKKITDYPDYVKQVLLFEPVARLLVQARYNYFGAMFLGQATPIRNGDLSQISPHLSLPHWLNWTAAKYRYGTWSLDLETFNESTISEFGDFLFGGMRAYTFMGSIGMVPKLDNELAHLLKNMVIDPKSKAKIDAIKMLRMQNPAPVAGSLNHRGVVEADFMDAFEQYRDSNSPAALARLLRLQL